MSKSDPVWDFILLERKRLMGYWDDRYEAVGDAEAAAERDADIDQLRAERDEWKQAAGVEAGLRREFFTKITEAAAFLDGLATYIERKTISAESAAADCRAMAERLRNKKPA